MVCARAARALRGFQACGTPCGVACGRLARALCVCFYVLTGKKNNNYHRSGCVYGVFMPEPRRAAVSQSEYARLRGVNKSQITRLKQQGRLVMAGKQVLVAESDALLDATSSPLPHHMAATEAHMANRQRDLTDKKNGDGLPFTPGGATLERIGLKLKYEQARKMEAEAEVAMMDRDQRAGLLLDATITRSLIASMGLVLRSEMEGFPDRYAGTLAAESSAERVHGMLMEAIERALENAAERVAGLARGSNDSKKTGDSSGEN